MADVSVALRMLLAKAKELLPMKKRRKQDSPEIPTSKHFESRGVGVAPTDSSEDVSKVDNLIKEMTETKALPGALISGTKDESPFYIGRGFEGREQVPSDAPQGTQYFDENTETMWTKDAVFGWVDMKHAVPAVKNAVKSRMERRKEKTTQTVKFLGTQKEFIHPISFPRAEALEFVPPGYKGQLNIDHMEIDHAAMAQAFAIQSSMIKTESPNERHAEMVTGMRKRAHSSEPEFQSEVQGRPVFFEDDDRTNAGDPNQEDSTVGPDDPWRHSPTHPTGPIRVSESLNPGESVMSSEVIPGSFDPVTMTIEQEDGTRVPVAAGSAVQLGKPGEVRVFKTIEEARDFFETPEAEKFLDAFKEESPVRRRSYDYKVPRSTIIDQALLRKKIVEAGVPKPVLIRVYETTGRMEVVFSGDLSAQELDRLNQVVRDFVRLDPVVGGLTPSSEKPIVDVWGDILHSGSESFFTPEQAKETSGLRKEEEKKPIVPASFFTPEQMKILEKHEKQQERYGEAFVTVPAPTQQDEVLWGQYMDRYGQDVRTINEIREAEGLPPIKNNSFDVPLADMTDLVRMIDGSQAHVGVDWSTQETEEQKKKRLLKASIKRREEDSEW